METRKVMGRIFIATLLVTSLIIGVTVGFLSAGASWDAIIIAFIVGVISYIGIIYLVLSALYYILNLIRKVEDE